MFTQLYLLLHSMYRTPTHLISNFNTSNNRCSTCYTSWMSTYTQMGLERTDIVTVQFCVYVPTNHWISWQYPINHALTSTYIKHHTTRLRMPAQKGPGCNGWSPHWCHSSDEKKSQNVSHLSFWLHFWSFVSPPATRNSRQFTHNIIKNPPRDCGLFFGSSSHLSESMTSIRYKRDKELREQHSPVSSIGW